jgi:tetratricopeptide (TPR) repeat protein
VIGYICCFANGLEINQNFIDAWNQKGDILFFDAKNYEEPFTRYERVLNKDKCVCTFETSQQG